MRGRVCNDVSGTYNHTNPVEIVAHTSSEADINDKLHFLREYVIARTDVYAIQSTDGRYRKISKELTDDVLLEHLSHRLTVGCYTSSVEGRVKFSLIDVDSHCGKETLNPAVVNLTVSKILTTLKEFGIPHLHAESSPGNFHIYVFHNPPAKTAEAFRFVRWITACAGCPAEEVFPKQEHVPSGEYGNLIRLPFSVHRKKLTPYKLLQCYIPAHGISQTTHISYHNIDEILKNIQTHDITGFNVQRPSPPPRTETAAGQTCAPHYNDGIPPCLQSLLASREPLTGGDGHYARLAIVSCYAKAGLNHAQICKLFVNQSDYDAAITQQQVHSVLKRPDGYSFSCPTLQAKCSRLVTPYCKNCKGLNRISTNGML